MTATGSGLMNWYSDPSVQDLLFSGSSFIVPGLLSDVVSAAPGPPRRGQVFRIDPRHPANHLRL